MRFTLGPILFFLCSFSAFAAPTKQPNVLFIAIDDLNDWVGCLGGHPQASTPAIDALAARGTLFLNAQVQAPLCNPSRASILTGLRPSSTGIYGLAPGIREVPRTQDCITLAQHFAQHGYFTASFGKIFHGGSIPPRLQSNEFTHWGPQPGMPFPKKKFVSTPDPIRAMDWGVFPADDKDQADWKTTDAAITQLQQRPQDKPFFLAVGFVLPHVPCFASQKWFDRLPLEQVQLPPYRADDRADTPDFAWNLHWKLPEPRLSWMKQQKQWKPFVQAYLASTSFMDSQIARLLSALEKSGSAENTIIVLWSDHGYHLGEKDITGKNTLWERSTRVPLIFAGPGISSKARCTRPAELLDLYPTLIELCQLSPRPGLEGLSLAPQLRDAAAPRERPAITTHNQGNHAVRSENWRYIRYADGSEELYDTRSDPNEWHNLAADPKHKAIIQEHRRWLPQINLPPIKINAPRVLVKKDQQWLWEGKPIEKQ